LAPEGQRRQRRRQQEDAVKTPALALLPLAIALAASPAAGARKGPVKIDPIRSAMSAAPASVAAHATIARANADGTMTTLRKGTNGFTCMPDNPQTPGPDPMCMDANAMTWAMAWMGHKPPPSDKPGVMYMLEGGTDFSNVDPYATKPDGAWIKTGPHVMVVGSAAVLAGYPSGPRPDTRSPYVMWAGTPYAHLMIPVR
jgi:hypothetical protein